MIRGRGWLRSRCRQTTSVHHEHLAFVSLSPHLNNVSGFLVWLPHSFASLCSSCQLEVYVLAHASAPKPQKPKTRQVFDSLVPPPHGLSGGAPA